MTTPDEMADALIDACAPDPKMQRVLDSWRRMYDGVCAELEEAIARAEAAEAQVAALRRALSFFEGGTTAHRFAGCGTDPMAAVQDCGVVAGILADTAAAARAYEARIRADERGQR